MTDTAPNEFDAAIKAAVLHLSNQTATREQLVAEIEVEPSIAVHDSVASTEASVIESLLRLLVLRCRAEARAWRLGCTVAATGDADSDVHATLDAAVCEVLSVDLAIDYVAERLQLDSDVIRSWADIDRAGSGEWFGAPNIDDARSIVTAIRVWWGDVTANDDLDVDPILTAPHGHLHRGWITPAKSTATRDTTLDWSRVSQSTRQALSDLMERAGAEADGAESDVSVLDDLRSRSKLSWQDALRLCQADGWRPPSPHRAPLAPLAAWHRSLRSLGWTPPTAIEGPYA